MANLEQLAKNYAMVLTGLYGQKDIAGKLTKCWRGPRHLTLVVRLVNHFQHKDAVALSETFALATHAEQIIGTRFGGYVVYQIQLPNHYWQAYTRRDCKGLVIGYGDMHRPIEFVLNPPHTLVAGTTGSGKTEANKSILVGLADEYKPDMAKIAIIDPHHDYDEFANSAHLMGPIASTGEDISKAIDAISQVFLHRRENNIRIDRPGGDKLPRYILMIDEADADIVLADKGNLAKVATISKEARKFGCHLVIGVQKATHRKLPDILSNLNQKFVGLVSDAKMSAVLTGRDGLECHKLTGHGDFVQVCGRNVNRFQVAMATPADIAKIDKSIPCPWDDFAINNQNINEQMINVAQEISQKKDESQDTGGRPQLQLSPRLLPYYVKYSGISRNQARDSLSPLVGFEVTRGLHELHRDFAKEFTIGFNRMKELIL